MSDIKISCFSDVHGRWGKVKLPPSDISLFAGDCMTKGYDERELRTFLAWYNKQPIQYKVMIAGNHDRYIENRPVEFREMLDKDYKKIIYLEESEITIQGVKIYGIPHTKIFYNWAFNRTEDKLKEIFGNIPKDTNILLTHGPQYSYLDTVDNGPYLGERELHLTLIKNDFNNLRAVVHGHIHDSYGVGRGVHSHLGGIGCTHIAINCAICNEQYEPVNSPILYRYCY